MAVLRVLAVSWDFTGPPQTQTTDLLHVRGKGNEEPQEDENEGHT